MNYKKKKGITLIALIITIIVMLILVSVTITTSVNSGLFEYARKAVKDANKVMEDEKRLTDQIIALEDVENVSYNTSETVRIVTYKNTKFLITGQNGNKMTLIPITFPNENKYKLSGKYIEVNGRQLSAELNNPNALEDEDFTSFSNRITEELDYICQERFGTQDNKIVATNTIGSDITLANLLTQYFVKCQNEAASKNFADITDAIEFEENEIFVLFNALPIKTIDGDYQAQYIVSNVANSLLTHINGLITACEFSAINLSSAEQQEIANNAVLLLKGNTNTESIVATTNLNREAAILLYYSSAIVVNSMANQFYINDCIIENEGDINDEEWRIDAYDAWDGYAIFSPLKRGENEYNTINISLAPALQVDQNLLIRTGQNTYNINVN